MDLLQLRYFQTVARHQHVSRAAQELHVAQPALSRVIARLEAELGVPLFDRRGRRVELNRFGAAFLIRVTRALGELHQASQELKDATGLARGNVGVAAETLRILTGLAAEFLEEHPKISLRLNQCSTPVMAEQLRAGEIDLCLASQPLEGSWLRATELLREEVFVAVPPAHRLARHNEVAIEDLGGEPFVTPRPGYWQRTLIDDMFARAGMTLTIACEGDELAAIRGLISAGVGVGLLPAVARRLTTHPPVAWLRLKAPECQRTLSVVWRQDTYVSAAARHFRDFTIDHFRRRFADGGVRRLYRVMPARSSL
jgi:DNA-binding transcriptional LysR family regulator